MFKQTPFYDTDAIAVLKSTAKKYGLKTVGDLKKVPGLSLCALPDVRDPPRRPLGLQQVYGVKNVKFVPLAGISVYTALDQHKCTIGDVFSTDPPLAGTKYTVLKDPKYIFGFQNVAPVVSKKLAQRSAPKFRRRWTRSPPS